jgi:WD40 repeat protein
MCRGAMILPLATACWIASSAAAAPPVTAAAFAPSGDAIVVGSQAGIEVRAWPSLELQRRLETRLAHVHHLAFSPDGAWLAAAGGAPREAGEIEWFDWPSGASRAKRHAHGDLVYHAAFSADGRLAATSAEGLVNVFDSSANPVAVLRGHSRGVLAAAWLPGDKQLVTAGIDQSLRLWDVASESLVRTLDNHTDEVRGLAVRPGGRAGPPLLASASADRTVRLWQPTIGRLVRFVRLAEEPLDINWTPDGALLLASCTDGHLRIIDPDTVEVLQDMPAIDGWAYTVVGASAGDFAFVAGAGGQMKAVRLTQSN